MRHALKTRLAPHLKKKMTHTINLNHITKIEGHAKLAIEIEKNKVKKCELSSIEGSRYFEGLVRNKKYFEAHEITSRICGICSCAHTVAANTAVERALGIETSHQTKQLNKLLMLGERIRSHAAHLYFLALPDYLGYESAIAMLPKYKNEVQSAITMMKAGNDLVRVIGGRDMHPVAAAVGGYRNIPTKQSLVDVAETMKKLKKDAIATAELFSKLTLYDYEHDCEFFSLKDEKEYAMLSGPLVSEKSKFEQFEYLDYFKEYHSPYSTANFVVKDDKPYMTGALARFNNNYDQLSDDAKKAVEKSGIKFPNKNPFTNNFAQAVELIHCMDHVITLCNELEPVQENIEKPKTMSGRGVAAIEVPRGLLFHDYTIENGNIINANIITPTAQNLKVMEDEIKDMLPGLLKLGEEEKINMEIEKLIRAYDPCFSCSSHFLEVEWKKK